MKSTRLPAEPGELQTKRFEGEGGLSLAADLGGPLGAPLVCLAHGGGQTRHAWRDTPVRLIDAGYRTVSIDLRGHGESDWSPDGDYDLPTTARDLEKIVRANDQGEGVCLVGASWGGLASLVCAPLVSDLSLRSIVLVDVVPRPDPRGGARIRDFMNAHLSGFADLDEAAAAVAEFRGEALKDSSRLMNSLRRGPDARLYWHWDPARLKRATFIDSDLIEDAARQIDAPVLLVRGELSDVVDDRGVDQLRNVLPTLEVVLIGQADHQVVGHNSRAFARSLLAFLARTAPPKRTVRG